ncbi:GNAT family N-acetyltransferase [Streptococcus gallolyticus]|nr:GNAT family N-acetyltransferase [Streptococcus gallolyticus]MBY5040713.1 GNAT family N-acetyltransferase [Streptococcus gallolyticus]
MELRRPSLADKEAILDMVEEFLAQDSRTDGLWNFAIGETVYEDWLGANQLQEMGLQGVPAIQFVAFDEDSLPLGFLSLRLRLNDNLLAVGGHIGYSVRPSQRGKGLAKAMLQAALAIAKSKNIKCALLTCHVDNPASRAVILANGGKLENVVDGVERYWIEVEGKYE